MSPVVTIVEFSNSLPVWHTPSATHCPCVRSRR